MGDRTDPDNNTTNYGTWRLLWRTKILANNVSLQQIATVTFGKVNEIRKITFGMLSMSLNNAVEMLKGFSTSPFFAGGGVMEKALKEKIRQ